MGGPIPVNKHDVDFAVDALMRCTDGSLIVWTLANDPRREVLAEFVRRIETERSDVVEETGSDQPKHRATEETNMPSPDLNAVRDTVWKSSETADDDVVGQFSVHRTETSFLGVTVEDALKLGLAD